MSSTRYTARQRPSGTWAVLDVKYGRWIIQGLSADEARTLAEQENVAEDRAESRLASR